MKSRKRLACDVIDTCATHACLVYDVTTNTDCNTQMAVLKAVFSRLSFADVDECASSPCQNGGLCTQPEPATFNCTCLEGYFGDRCQQGEQLEK